MSVQCMLGQCVPAKETRLSVMHLSHRVRWNEFKISTVIMAMFTREDRNLLFKQKHLLYRRALDGELLGKRSTNPETPDV